MDNNALETLTSIIAADQPDRFRDALATVEDMLEPAQKNALLDYCINQRRFEEMGLVLLAGADPDRQRETSRSSLLIEAVGRSQIETALLLLLHGANPNAVDIMGDAPVHFAARRNLPSVIDLLARYDADLGLRNHMGQDAFTVAALNGSRSVWHALENAGYQPGDLDGLRRAAPSLDGEMEVLVNAKLTVPEAIHADRRPSL